MLEVKTLGEICQLEKGSIQTGPFGSQLHQSDYTEVGIPVIMPADIINGKVLEDRIARVDDNFADKLQRHTLEIGDIVFARRGDIGRQALITSREENWLCGTGCLKVNLGKKEIISPIFLHYYFKLPEVVDYLKNQAIGATMPNLNTEILKRIPIRYPSIENQNKIIGILSAYDELIENNKKRIALLEAMAEELYKEWFVRFRFPNYENTEFEKAVPKDWLERPTSELFEILGGGTPSKDEEEYWKDGEINWFTPSDLTKGSSLFIENSELKCNETGLSKSSAKLFPAFSIMMTSRATIGVLSINTTEACTNQGFITCLPNEQFPLTYLYFWLKFSKPYFDILANGATFAELSRGVFKKIKMRVPTQDLIDKFDNFCKPVFDEILNIQRQTENLTIQKNQLLPRLISGKLSVEHLDIQQPPTPAQPTDSE